ncbi:MAG: response regulator [Planctomycetes bacterium]|nr:response regulator [Planctomycetota bacterium]
MRGPVSLPPALRDLDRRDGQLWGLSCVIIAALTAGFFLLHQALPQPPASWERFVLFGQAALIALTLAYFVQKRAALLRLRRRFVQHQIQSESLRDRYGALGSTLAFTTRVGTLKTEARILQYAAEQTLTTLRADHCMIGLVPEIEEGPPSLRAHLAREGIADAASSAAAWRMARAWVRAHNASVLLSSRRPPGPPPGPELPDGVQALIAAPIRWTGWVAGALLVTLEAGAAGSRRSFGQYDRRLVEIIANATSAAVDNCRLAARLKRRRDQLRKSLKRLRLAQPALILSERLKAMEELVDKVAHYISNPLTTIAGYAQLLKTQDIDDGVARCLTTIGEEVERCNQAINDLKSFAHRPPSEPRQTDLNQLLKQALFLKAHRFNRLMLAVDFAPDPELGPVVLDPVQVQQAFLNVLTDVESALAAGRDYRLGVRTERVARMLRIRFTVTHQGQDPPAAPWQPFAGTAAAADEHHLGRDILLAVIRGHGGRTSFWTDAGGRASHFAIDLPRGPVTPDAAVVDAPRLPGVSGEHAGRRILVVDDEERLLNLFRRVLVKEGFRVTATASGQEAIRLLETDAFDAVIVDYHMPDLHGRAVAEHLLAHRPALARRLILTTGDAEARDFRELRGRAQAVALAKPFQIGEMLATVRATVGRVDRPREAGFAPSAPQAGAGADASACARAAV